MTKKKGDDSGDRPFGLPGVEGSTEFFFYIPMPQLDNLIAELDAIKIPFEKTEQNVVYYSAEGGSHIATTIIASAAVLLVKSIRDIIKACLEFNIQSRQLCRIKIKTKDVEINISDETQLDAAVAAALKIRKAATQSGRAKQPPRRQAQPKKKPSSQGRKDPD